MSVQSNEEELQIRFVCVEPCNVETRQKIAKTLFTTSGKLLLTTHVKIEGDTFRYRIYETATAVKIKAAKMFALRRVVSDCQIE
jgi:hypothetical protein